MTKSTHTPGPWSHQQFDKHTGQITAPDLQVGCIAHVYAKGEAVYRKGELVGYNDVAQFEANAALIAAAPDLLAALQNLFAAIEDGQLVRNIEGDEKAGWTTRALALVKTLKSAHTAIAKATGGQS